MGLKPQMLGKSIAQLQSVFMKLEQSFSFNVCGEGGEYESAVFDCPLFKHKLELVESEVVDLGNDYNPVSYLVLKQISKVEKSEVEKSIDFEILSKLRK